MRIIWSATAVAELDGIVRYIAQDDVQSALRVEDRILKAAGRLAEFPFSGRRGAVVGSRELVVARTSCLMIYRVSEQGVDILRIVHGARLWPPR